MSDNREVRCLVRGLELRAAADSKGPGTVVGYSAVFDKFSEDLGGFREKITPGAFADALPRSDVRALANHDPTMLLGREKAGTLRMEEDKVGLRVSIDLPDTSVGRDTAESIRRGDMDGMSFAFTLDDSDDADDWEWNADVPVRTIKRFGQIYDVGPVTYPAYPDTSAAMRSLDRCQQKQKTEVPPALVPDRDGDSRDFVQSAWARQRLAEATLLP